MFLRTTATYWKDSVGHDMIRGNTEFFFNTNRMTDIISLSATKSRIMFLDAVKEHRMKASVLECNSTIAEIRTAGDTVLPSKFLDLSIFPKNNTSKTAIDLKIQASDIVYVRADGAGDWTWIYYDTNKGEMVLALADLTMDEFEMLVTSPINLTFDEDTQTLSWTDVTGGEDGFEIWVSEDGGAFYLLDTVASDVTTYTDSTTTGDTMIYKVRAYIGTTYSGFSNTVSFSWSAYWDSLISATVENAAPTHVVLTFPSANTSLVASDFTIAGFTINSVSWAGAVLTLVLADTVIYGDVLVVTFGKTGQTANVTNNVSLDANAAIFITATGVTDETEKAAVNRLVVELKAINDTQANFVNFDTPASSICKAIYPFMGTTAVSQKYNLIDPRDLDAAFRLVWTADAAEAHTSQGYYVNGTTQYADTKFNPSTKTTINSGHVSVYCVDNPERNGYVGCYATTKFLIRGKVIHFSEVQMYDSGSAAILSNVVDDAIGFTIGNRQSNTKMDLLRNGKNLKRSYGVGGTIPNLNVTIGMINHATTKIWPTMAGTIGYSSMGDGMSDDAVKLYSTAVNKFMVSMGRRTAEITRITAGVCFDFDDIGNRNSWSLYQPWLSAMYGLKSHISLEGVAFVGADLLFIRDLLLLYNGSSVGGHTVNHTDALVYIATHTIQEYYDDEVAPNIAALQLAYGISYKTHTYAYGSHNDALDNFLLADGFATIMGYGTSDYNGTTQVVNYYSLNNDEYDIDIIKGEIDTALANNEIRVFVSHAIGDGVDTNTISLANLKEVCNYVNSKNMSYYNFTDLVPGLFS